MLAAHPKLSMAVVIGEPDPRLGERAVIVAVPESAENDLNLDELCDYLTDQGLPKQNLPERLIVVDDLPRTGLGKFHRVKIQLMVAGLAEKRASQVA